MSADFPAAGEPGKQRIIQEFVPGKQVTLAHLIANPVGNLTVKLGLPAPERANAIGILTITPAEAAIIAADVATKSAMVEIGFVDRFSGALLITGDVQAVDSALHAVLALLAERMGFTPAEITRS
ncbi:MAG: BMC domain-containing protein [Propionibacteriaceae bacterium]|nr:BMC domain-containing protein [Propionibacteriaceae bacterium]